MSRSTSPRVKHHSPEVAACVDSLAVNCKLNLHAGAGLVAPVERVRRGKGCMFTGLTGTLHDSPPSSVSSWEALPFRCALQHHCASCISVESPSPREVGAQRSSLTRRSGRGGRSPSNRVTKFAYRPCCLLGGAERLRRWCAVRTRVMALGHAWLSNIQTARAHVVACGGRGRAHGREPGEMFL
jgi:hypothetical protein